LVSEQEISLNDFVSYFLFVHKLEEFQFVSNVLNTFTKQAFNFVSTLFMNIRKKLVMTAFIMQAAVSVSQQVGHLVRSSSQSVI